jgi:hypothetical protein
MSQPKGRRIEDSLARDLRKAGVSFKKRPTLGGLQPDFLVKTTGGRQIILETKRWRGDKAHIARASQQARLYRKVTKAADAFVIVPSLRRSRPAKGVLSSGDLETFILRKAWPSTKRRTKGKTSKKKTTKKKLSGTRRAASKRTVFAAMPFAAEFDDVFFIAMAHAAKAAGTTCIRVDREDFEGDIVTEIERKIRSSVAVIADLSGSRPNVLYEVGYAHGLRRPVIPICSTPLKKLPFDIRNWNAIAYSVGSSHKLRSALTKRLKAAISRTA